MPIWARPRSGCRSYQMPIQMGAIQRNVMPTTHSQTRSMPGCLNRIAGTIALFALLALSISLPAAAQSTGTVIPVGLPQYLTDTGAPCNACKLYVYTAGTTTLATVYQDASLSTAHANPIILSAAGRPPANIYMGSATLKFVLKTSADATIWTADNVAATGLQGVVQVGSTLTIAGVARETSVISPTQLTANQNNWNPTGLSSARIIRISSDAARTITGIVAQPAGTLLTIYNTGSQNIILAHADTVNSSAANVIICPGAVSLTLNGGDSATIWYDSVNALWRVIGY